MIEPSTSLVGEDSMFPQIGMLAPDEYFWIIVAIIAIGSLLATVWAKKKKTLPFLGPPSRKA